ERDGMEAGVRRLRLEAEYIAVGDVVGDGLQVTHQALSAGQLEVLTAGQARDRLRDVLLQAVARGHEGNGREAQRRREQGQAVEGLRARGLGQVDVGIVGVAAEATVRWAGFTRLRELRD